MAHRFIVAGGGTAGHIEPALAVADAIIAKDSRDGAKAYDRYSTIIAKGSSDE